MAEFFGLPRYRITPRLILCSGAATVTVMARLFGTDLVSFSRTSGAPYPGITHRFWSFSEAARENGAPRILAGIHFRTAVNEGYVQGARIGEWILEHTAGLWPIRQRLQLLLW